MIPLYINIKYLRIFVNSMSVRLCFKYPFPPNSLIYRNNWLCVIFLGINFLTCLLLWEDTTSGVYFLSYKVTLMDFQLLNNKDTSFFVTYFTGTQTAQDMLILLYGLCFVFVGVFGESVCVPKKYPKCIWVFWLKA